VVSLSLFLLMRLKARRVEDFDSFRVYAKKVVAGGDVLFLPALNFLYLLGLINYLPKSDSFEYLGSNETL